MKLSDIILERPYHVYLMLSDVRNPIELAVEEGTILEFMADEYDADTEILVDRKYGYVHCDKECTLDLLLVYMSASLQEKVEKLKFHVITEEYPQVDTDIKVWVSTLFK